MILFLSRGVLNFLGSEPFFTLRMVNSKPTRSVGRQKNALTPDEVRAFGLCSM